MADDDPQERPEPVEYKSWTGIPGDPELVLAVDHDAETADPSKPGVLAPPAGAPAYHGFTVLPDVVVDGFTLGVVTAMGPADRGDAFVIAPDGSRAGLAWELGAADGRVYSAAPPEERRWGVFRVVFARPMASEEDARENPRAIVPALREAWQERTRPVPPKTP